MTEVEIKKIVQDWVAGLPGGLDQPKDHVDKVVAVAVEEFAGTDMSASDLRALLDESALAHPIGRVAIEARNAFN
jgi:hypothetical protein